MFERRKSSPPEIGADNILRNDVEVTFKTFLEGVYAGRSKPFREAAFRIGYGIFRGGSTLLSSIVRAVHPDNRDPDRDKEMRERCSEWLSRDVDDPIPRGVPAGQRAAGACADGTGHEDGALHHGTAALAVMTGGVVGFPAWQPRR